MDSLAVKYRPKTLTEVIGQDTLIKTLQRQIETGKISHSYLFCGPSGDGKTTTARAFSLALNQGHGNPIEIDGASNNGVEAVRSIIESARERAIDCEYKIFIIDEAHMITPQGWNAFLKTIEEPSAYTIFIFCTTNPEKIPATILNRCMRFNLTKIDTKLIKDRLLYISQKEGFVNYTESCDFIAKLSSGGMRDAISMLEKCASYNNDLSIQNVLYCLGDFSYDSLFDFTGALVNGDEQTLLLKLEEYYNSGKDLKLFVDQYLDFALDLCKYCLFQDMSMVKIPAELKARCDGYCSIPDSLTLSNKLVEKTLEIKNAIKYDVNSKLTIEAMFIAMEREVTLND